MYLGKLGERKKIINDFIQCAVCFLNMNLHAGVYCFHRLFSCGQLLNDVTVPTKRIPRIYIHHWRHTMQIKCIELNDDRESLRIVLLQMKWKMLLKHTCMKIEENPKNSPQPVPDWSNHRAMQCKTPHTQGAWSIVWRFEWWSSMWLWRVPIWIWHWFVCIYCWLARDHIINTQLKESDEKIYIERWIMFQWIVFLNTFW